jgi:hypothetical protein
MRDKISLLLSRLRKQRIRQRRRAEAEEQSGKSAAIGRGK